jgi:hypothetical protein
VAAKVAVATVFKITAPWVNVESVVVCSVQVVLVAVYCVTVTVVGTLTVMVEGTVAVSLVSITVYVVRIDSVGTGVSGAPPVP